MEPIERHAELTPPGWFADPWGISEWRWWDGRMWTALVGGTTERKPRLPGWLSWPVVLAAVPILLVVVAYAADSPLAVLLGFVPLVIVLPAFWWLDRVEPEPRSSLIHSLLWGATVAVLISSTINAIVAASAGLDFAAIVSAPLVEEATKGLGIYWAVRRKQLDSIVDGVIYAGWVAIGFAVIEDFQYFSSAESEDQLLAVFIIRGLLTPFAHPLFTFWTGAAAGLAVERGRRVVPFMIGGYGLAVLTHGIWNGALTASESAGSGTLVVVAIGSFLVLFLAVVISLVRIRQRERRLLIDSTPMLVQRYGLTENELHTFGDWKQMLSSRRRLSKPQRRSFDLVHAALARLAVLHGRPGPVDPIDEARLVTLLHQARQRSATQGHRS